MESKNKTLSVCMIVKNEQLYLKECLESVKDIVDEIIIVDTGSTDATVEIASEYTSHIYYIDWEDDFSKARNEALKYATCDFILLLDADEILEESHKDKLKNLINTTDKDGFFFNIYNYKDREKGLNYNIHQATRLIRNHKGFQYKGRIHEQISSEGKLDPLTTFVCENIVLHHYGYLDKVVKSKEKNSRNIHLIEEELEGDKENHYYLFTLANEYYSMNDILKAIKLYEEVLEKAPLNYAYMPNLFLRLITCYMDTKQYSKALKIAHSGKNIFKEYLDFYYMSASIHFKIHHYTIAIAELELLDGMIDKNNMKVMIGGCDTYRAPLMLGDIYTELEDYTKAMEYYSRVIKETPDLSYPISQYAHILNKIYKDKADVVKKLRESFSSLEIENNLLVFYRIMLTEKLVDYLSEDIEQEKQYTLQDLFELERGKYFFYKQQYVKAKACFERVLNSEDQYIEQDQKDFCVYCLVLLLILTNTYSNQIFIDYLNQLPQKHQRIAMRLIFHIGMNKKDIEEVSEEDSKKVIKVCLDCYNELLYAREYQLFEKLLYALNYINDKQSLLELAKLYNRHELFELGMKTAYQSIKETDLLDSECAYQLFHYLTYR